MQDVYKRQIYHMKLEQGHFHLPVINTEEGRIKAIETFWNDLVMMVQGMDGDVYMRQLHTLRSRTASSGVLP